VLGTQGLHLALLEVGVHLNLIYGRDDGRLVEQVREVVDHKVADADGSNLAVLEQCLECPVGIERALELARQSLVQDQQVDLVDAELPHALHKTVQCLLVSEVADPDLCLDGYVCA
jgi:hypothetical protein